MVSYAQVLGALEDDGARRIALAVFAKLGGNRDRWAAKDRVAMVDALSRAEDCLELGRPKTDRTGIRAVRRELEAELD